MGSEVLCRNLGSLQAQEASSSYAIPTESNAPELYIDQEQTNVQLQRLGFEVSDEAQEPFVTLCGSPTRNTPLNSQHKDVVDHSASSKTRRPRPASKLACSGTCANSAYIPS